MKITDEMIEAISNETELYIGDVKHCLTAAYPLIRKQVLLEAAEVCKALVKDWGSEFNGNACCDLLGEMAEE